MALCNVTDAQKTEYRKKMNDMWNYWLDKPGIKERFTDARTGNYDGESSAKSMRSLINNQLELPWTADYVYTDKQLSRVKTEIDSFNNALNGKFSNLAFIVPEGISKQDPVARQFYLKLNDILNRERVNTNTTLTANARIADHMLKGYISIHGGKTDKAIEKIRKLRNQAIEAESQGLAEQDFIEAIEKFVLSDKEGVTVKQMIELMEMPRDEFNKVPGKNYRNAEGKLTTYNTNIYQAAKEARALTRQVGSVYIRGLESLQRVGALKFANTSSISEAKKMSKDAERFITKIQETIDYLNGQLETEGYFPHVNFETMLSVKNRLSDALVIDGKKQDTAFGNLAADILNQINIGSMPGHAKGRNPSLVKWYDKDPMMVLKEYGDQAVQFNKLIYTQQTYLETLKMIPRSNMKFVKGMKNFINEEFAVFTRGTGARPDFVNKAVTSLNAVQTARTMGLNITGAIKNAASAINYYSRVGIKTISETTQAVSHDREFQDMLHGHTDKVTGKRIRGVEEEAGFLFQDVATELYTEGLITRDQLESKEIEFNPATGKITLNKKPIVTALKKAGKYTLKGALFFHRLTENSQRKWMFRTALHQKYTHLVDNGYNKKDARTFAQNYALKMVNGWAYEYAAHAKPKLLRGEWRTIETMDNGGIIQQKFVGVAGGMSEVAFHLLHYPLSLMESQWSGLKGAYKAAISGQGLDSGEIQYVMRFAGVQVLLSLAGAVLNINFRNILENETLERTTRVLDDLIEYDNPDKGTFGLLSEFTGPTIGTLKYLATAQNIIDIEHSDLNKILFGNVDFGNENDLAARKYSAYQWSTEWGVIKNKLAPAVKDGRGRDVLMHTLKLYPSATTKWGHEFIFGKKRSKRKKKQSKNQNVAAALRVLEGMREGS